MSKEKKDSLKVQPPSTVKADISVDSEKTTDTRRTSLPVEDLSDHVEGGSASESEVLNMMRGFLDEMNEDLDAERMEILRSRIESGFYGTVVASPALVQRILADLRSDEI